MIPIGFLFFSIPLVYGITIECEFEHEEWSAVGSVYQCTLNSDPEIMAPGMQITVAHGSHSAYKSNADVEGFHSESSSQAINFIPQGLSALFPKLIFINIQHGRVKELYENDLSGYVNLERLDLAYNDISTLEHDVFRFNTELRLIYLHDNKITKIQPTVFDRLVHLEFLYLGNNPYISKNADNSTQAVLGLVRDVKISHLLALYDEGAGGLERLKASLLEENKNTLERMMANMTAQVPPLVEMKESSDYGMLLIFIALPAICLLTILNVIVVVWIIKRMDEQKKEKKPESEIALNEM